MRVGGDERTIHFHDYHEIFAVPGLYERIFHDHLECRSPAAVVGLLGERLRARRRRSGGDLRARRRGGQRDRRRGSSGPSGSAGLVGVDILPEAAAAAARDRPGVYDDYSPATSPRSRTTSVAACGAAAPNCLTTVAALGFDDMPPEALQEAYDIVADDGWIAFNIKADFLDAEDATGFRRLIADLVRSEALKVCDRRRYRHRLSMHREPLDYVAVVGSQAPPRRSLPPRDVAAAPRGMGARTPPSACKRLHNGAVRSSSVTLRDVARAAQVHPGTVSRALNAETRGLVNQETAERVMRAAEELGYRPNPIARGLKTNRSFTVGVLVPDLTNPLFPPIVRGIEDRLGAAGLHVADRQHRQRPGPRAPGLRGDARPPGRRVHHRDRARSTASSWTRRAGLGEPIVLVNRRLEDESLPAVTVDDREGARLAVEHVVALGPPPGRPPRRPAGAVHRPPAPPRVPSRRWPPPGIEVEDRAIRFAPAFVEDAGARVCRELLDAYAGRHRDRRGQRPARARLL